MKRLISILALIVSIITLCLVLGSCGDNGPHTHEFGEWIVLKEETCTEIGNREKRCSCGAVQAEVINAKGHDYSEEGVCNNCQRVLLIYSLSTDGSYYIVSGISDRTQKSVKIADSYAGKPVRAIGEDAFLDCDVLEEIIVPSTLTKIGKNAFKNCTSLKSFTIPEATYEIGEGAFAYCSSLKELVIPSTVTSLGKGVLYYCKSIEGFTFPESIKEVPDNMFYYCTSLEQVNLHEDMTAIGEYSFLGCSKLKGVLLGDKIEIVKKGAFSYCGLIEEMIIPDSVTELGESVFENCYSLKEISLGTGVSKIGKSAFARCKALTGIELPDLEVLESRILYGCTSLKELTIPETVSIIGSEFISGCVGLSEIVLPEYTIEIGKKAFAGCTGITSLVIPQYVLIIEDGLAQGCTSLEEITIMGEITEIGDFAFENCKKLQTIVIPDTTLKAGEDVFKNCESLMIFCLATEKPKGWDRDWNSSKCPVKWGVRDFGETSEVVWEMSVDNEVKITQIKGSLTSIVIPQTIKGATVTTICKNAFKDFKLLESVTLPEGLKYIEDGAFENCYRLTSITLPSTLEAIGENAFNGCYSLVEVVDLSSALEIDKNEENGSVGKYALDIYTSADFDSKLVVDGELVFHKNGDFYSLVCCKARGTNVILPDSIEGSTYTIRGYALASCQDVEELTIPSFFTVIEKNTFNGMASLKSVTIPTGVETIGEGAFEGCSALESVKISEGLLAIEKDAFKSCGALTSINIPSTLTKIDGAFEGCNSLAFNEYENGSYLGNDQNPYFAFIQAKSKDVVFCVMNGDTKVVNTNALKGCEKLVRLEVPASLSFATNLIPEDSSIRYATVPCELVPYLPKSSLLELTINSGTELTSGALKNCTALTRVILPNTIEHVASDAFEGCVALVFGEYEKGYYVGSLDNMYMVLVKAKGKLISDCTISPRTKVIADGAFEGCSRLESITIPASVKTIPQSAFADCSSLYSVTIENGVEKIGNEAFKNCISLYYVGIPESISAIGEEAFYGCSELSGFALKEGILSIGKGAFTYCAMLELTEYEGGYYLGTSTNDYYALIGLVDTSVSNITPHASTVVIADGLLD
ncbi:MAG: leucine-rich repeat domain-containing protein [Clostridia bacterium]|nr:leucine-rich repeat domain-containing protein [Clostridia bacterium]